MFSDLYYETIELKDFDSFQVNIQWFLRGNPLIDKCPGKRIKDRKSVPSAAYLYPVLLGIGPWPLPYQVTFVNSVLLPRFRFPYL